MSMDIDSDQSTVYRQRGVPVLAPSERHCRRQRKDRRGESEEASPRPTAIEQCPECHGILKTAGGETICTECGLVIAADRLDRGPEWRSFENDEHDPERTGAPLTASRHDRGLSTEIGRHRDGYGNELSWEKRRQLTRLRREHARGRFGSKREQNLAHGLGEVQRVASALGLDGGFTQQACVLFRRAQEEDLLYGRSIEAIAAASVYGVCRCNGLGRSLDEFEMVAACAQSQLTRAYSVLNGELGLPAKPITPRAFVPRIASALEVSSAVERQARLLAGRAEKVGLTNGKQPSGFAAACLYRAAREHHCRLTQGEIAAAADTSCVTLRTHFRALKSLDAEVSKKRGVPGEPRAER